MKVSRAPHTPGPVQARGAAPTGVSLPGWVLSHGMWHGAVPVLPWYLERARMCCPGIPAPLSPPAHPAPLPCFAVENPAHCEFPLLQDLLIR